MDTTNWKRILLHWANQSGLFERTFYNLEQTDLEDFFTKFCNRITVISVKQTDLSAFCKQYYPKFEPHVDDAGQLSSADYMYVFSLFLHFSCVKFPEDFFHKVCQALPDQYQQAIATFFKIVLEKDELTKENLRNAIAEASPKTTLPFLAMESPIRTPRGKFSPPTPKTNMLEERTREINWLRAHLETEKYEKGFLEVQIRQYEEKIDKLSKDKRNYITEIQKLKNDLLALNTENCSPNKNAHDEQIKKRLRKTIEEKEEALLNLRENLETLRENEVLLSEKLAYSEKQVVACLEKIKDLENHLNILTVEMEQKESVIRSLRETNNDLQQFIHEMKSPSNLNISIECLDNSLIRTPNSSGSLSSPENLARSVVDIQLREKQIENIELKERVEKIEYDNRKLAKHIIELIEKNSNTFEICKENLIVTEDSDIAQIFVVFENYFEKLVDTYNSTEIKNKQQKDEINELTLIKNDLSKRMAEANEQLSTYEKHLAFLKTENINLGQKAKKLESINTNQMADIKQRTAENVKLQNQIKELQNQMAAGQRERNMLEKKNLTFADQLCEMSTSLEEAQETSNQRRELVESLSLKIANCEDDLNQAKEVIKSLEMLKHDQLSEISKLKLELQNSQTEREVIQAKLYSSRAEYADRVKDLKQVKGKVEEQVDYIRGLEKDLEKIRAENLKLCNGKVELLTTTQSLQESVEQSKLELQKMSDENQRKENIISEITENFNGFKNEITVNLQRLQAENNDLTSNLQQKLEKIADNEFKIEELNAVVAELNSKIQSFKDEVTEGKDIISNFEIQQRELNDVKDSLMSEKNRLESDLVEFQERISREVSDVYSILVEIDEEMMKETHVTDIKLPENNVNQFINGTLGEKSSESDFSKTVHNQEKICNAIKEFSLSLKQKVQVLEKRFENSENQCGFLSEEVQKLRKEAIKLNETHETLKKSCAYSDEFGASLQAEVAKKIDENKKLSVKNHNLQQQLESLKESVTELQLRFEFSNGNCQKLETQINELQSEILEVKKIKDELFEKTENLTKENAELKQEKIKSIELQEYRRRESNLAANNEKLEKEIKILKETEKTLLNKGEELNAQINQLGSDLKMKEISNKDLKELNNRLEKLNQDLQKEKSDLMQKNATEVEVLSDANKNLQTEIEELNERLMGVEIKLKETETSYEELKALNKQLEDLKEKWQTEKTELMRKSVEEVQVLTNENKTLQVKINELESVIKETEIFIKELKTINKQLEEMTEELQNEKSNLEKKIENFEIEIQTFKTEILSVREMNGDLEKQLRGFKASCEELVGTKNSLEILRESFDQEKKSLTNEIKTFTVEICKLTADVESRNQVVFDLQEKVKQQIERIQFLQSDLNSANESLEHQIKLLKDEKSANQKIRTELENTNENLSQEKDKQQLKLEEFKQQLETKNEHISSFESENVYLKLKVEELNMLIAELQNSKQKMLENLNDAKLEIVSQANIHKLQNGELFALKKLLTNLKSELKGLRANSEIRVNELQITLTQTTRNIVTLMRQFVSETNKLKAENEELAVSSNSLQEKLKTLEFSRKEFELQLIEAKKSLENEQELKENISVESKRNLTDVALKLAEVSTENKQLRESKEKSDEANQILNKRVEKLSLKLGEYQATKSKLEKINAELKGAVDSLQKDAVKSKNLIEHLQKESKKLQTELKESCTKNAEHQKTVENLQLQWAAIKGETLSDKADLTEQFETERKELFQKIEELSSAVNAKQEKNSLNDENHTLRHSLEIVQQELTKSKAEVIDYTSKISELQTLAETLNNDKAKLIIDYEEMQNQVSNYKQIVSDLEIEKVEYCEKIQKMSMTLTGMMETVNSVNVEKKSLLDENSALAESIDSSRKLHEDQQKSNLDINIIQSELREKNETLTLQIENLVEENSKLSDKLTKLSLRLQIYENSEETKSSEVTELNSALEKLKAEKDSLQSEHDACLIEIKKLLASTTDHSELTDLKAKLESQVKHSDRVESELQKLKQAESDRVAELLNKIEDLQAKFESNDQIFSQEKELNAKLKSDILILQAKLYKNRQTSEEKEKQWLDEKKKLVAETDAAEQRIKENRLEMEGKLEKMKTKMKTLYSEEVSKIKTKHEREIVEMNMKLKKREAEVGEYKLHVKKLSTQIFQLNETVLELQKQNKFMETKLRESECLSFGASMRRGQNHHLSSGQILGSNLRMEDEEGEIFNNTYLADLKSGQMSPTGRESVCATELQYRNSLAPMHLRSTYTAQYADQHLREEDLKDVVIPHNLDDSLTSLLHNGQRKKLSGTTSYKKPGPPTPSKNAGRLSFGGNSEIHPREILKESNERESFGGTTKRPTTPGKFKNMFSSSRSSKDENTPVNQTLSLTKKRRKSITKSVMTPFSSTPRKSKIHFNQRAQLDRMLNGSSKIFDAPIPAKNQHKLMQNEDNKDLCNPEELFNWRQPDDQYTTDSCTTSDSNSVNFNSERENDSIMSTVRRKKFVRAGKERRFSINYSKGQLFQKSKLPSRLLKDQLRRKAKIERCANFNRFRKSLADETAINIRKSLLNKSNRISNTNPETLIIARNNEFSETAISCNSNQNDEIHLFEKLVAQKDNNAPFDVSNLQLTSSETDMYSSKTLYSGNTFVNRKIPHLNSTMVRKSSFYLRSRRRLSVQTNTNKQNESIETIPLSNINTKLLLFIISTTFVLFMILCLIMFKFYL